MRATLTSPRRSARFLAPNPGDATLVGQLVKSVESWRTRPGGRSCGDVIDDVTSGEVGSVGGRQSVGAAAVEGE